MVALALSPEATPPAAAVVLGDVASGVELHAAAAPTISADVMNAAWRRSVA